MDPMQMWNYVKSASKTSITCFVIKKLLFLALRFAQIAIGAVYLQDCPQQCYIPVYVLVCGVFIIFLLLLSCLPCTTETEEGRQRSCIRNVLKCLVSVILVCWMICGSVWIYSVYPPNYNQTMAGDAYCNKTLYLFAFWTTILGNILLGLVLLCGCCVWACIRDEFVELVCCVALALD